MPLDIGVGILLSIIVSEVFGVPLTPFLLAVGIAAALLPDIDVVTALFGKWHHRGITHYPMVYVPFGLLIFIFLPLPLAVLISAGVITHFIHDTIGTGWGIAWFWPLSPRRYLFFPEGGRRTEMGAVSSWLPEEKPEYTHTGSHMTWIREVYLRSNPVAYIEYGVFLISLLTLAAYLWYKASI